MPDQNIPMQAVRPSNGFVVVSRLHGGFAYDHYTTLRSARESYAAIARGDHPKYQAVGMFAAIDGMPVGSALDVDALDSVAPGSAESPENRHLWAQFKRNHPDCVSGVAYARGIEARKSFGSITWCPYIEGEEAQEWRAGFRKEPSKYAAVATWSGEGLAADGHQIDLSEVLP
jgi:hypothetical protein